MKIVKAIKVEEKTKDGRKELKKRVVLGAAIV